MSHLPSFLRSGTGETELRGVTIYVAGWSHSIGKNSASEKMSNDEQIFGQMITVLTKDLHPAWTRQVMGLGVEHH